MRMTIWRALLASLVLFGTSGATLSQGNLGAMGCGSLENAYGPFDYRFDKDKLGVVERFHFDSDVETLTRGKSTRLGGDIDYTLRAFPNHHRALIAMMNLGRKEGTNTPGGAGYSVECYIARAEAFRPDDAMVSVIYGLHLLRAGKPDDALKKLDAAKASETTDANVHYNLGLAYVQLKQFDKALESAHQAYAMGFPLPGLKNQLQRAGRWREVPMSRPSPAPLGKTD